MSKNKLPVRFTGQHFTIDKVLIEDAIKVAKIKENDNVFDIGAGKGFLTVQLVRHCSNIFAIENDKSLINHLRKNFSYTPNVKIIEIDFRKYTIPKIDFKVVSNIPFGITSEILKSLMFDNAENFIGGALVMQLEPAKKLFSNKIFNPYTVFYHTFFDIKMMYEIYPESFMPPPKVKSALVKIERKDLPLSFDLKAKYLMFINCLLQKPDLPVRTILKSIFRKSQVKVISVKYGVNLDCPIVSLPVNQWKNCFLEMLNKVPEKYHPT